MKRFELKSIRKKLKKNYFSCGDLRIYPIREIRGSNRILYGDKYDNGDWFESRDGFYHQPRDNPTEYEYSEPFPKNFREPVYSEIVQSSQSCVCLLNTPNMCEQEDLLNTPNMCEQARYEKLYHFYSSHPSLKSDSCDSGYRSVSQVFYQNYVDFLNDQVIHQNLMQEPTYENQVQERCLILIKGR